MSAGMPSLAEFHVSETHGFLLEDPLEELPAYFQEWNRIGRQISDLLKAKQLRNEVDRMPELLHTRLCGYRQTRVAYMFLTFMANGYVWQEGEHGLVQRLPRNLAVPLCAIAKALGMQPAMCHASCCLSNWQLHERSGDVCVENMHAICFLPGGRHFEWFCIATAQIELDAVPGLKAIVKAMSSIGNFDTQQVVESLEQASQALLVMRAGLLRLYEELGSNEFFDLVRPFLTGWGGEGSRLPDGIVYEGVSKTPIKVTGGSAAQCSVLHCYDAFLGIHHDKAKREFLENMLEYMPRDHANFIRAIRRGPSLRQYVLSSGENELKEAYDACVKTLLDFRSTHIQIVTKYIVGPSGRQSRQRDYSGIDKKGTGGQDLIPFLKSLRNTTADALVITSQVTDTDIGATSDQI